MWSGSACTLLGPLSASLINLAPTLTPALVQPDDFVRSHLLFPSHATFCAPPQCTHPTYLCCALSPACVAGGGSICRADNICWPTLPHGVPYHLFPLMGSGLMQHLFMCTCLQCLETCVYPTCFFFLSHPRAQQPLCC